LKKLTRKSIIVSVFRRFQGAFFKEEGGVVVGTLGLQNQWDMHEGSSFSLLSLLENVFLSPF